MPRVPQSGELNWNPLRAAVDSRPLNQQYVGLSLFVKLLRTVCLGSTDIKLCPKIKVIKNLLCAFPICRNCLRNKQNTKLTFFLM